MSDHDSRKEKRTRRKLKREWKRACKHNDAYDPTDDDLDVKGPKQLSAMHVSGGDRPAETIIFNPENTDEWIQCRDDHAPTVEELAEREDTKLDRSP